jgi:hypothetical protein
MRVLNNTRRGEGQGMKGRVTRRHGAKRWRFAVEQLETRRVLSNFVLSGTAAADTILVRRDPANAALAQVQVNGAVLFNGPVVAGDTITVNGLGGNDTINIRHTFSGVPVTANGGADNDTIRISDVARFLDDIDGDVIVNGDTGTDSLIIFDQNNTFSDTFDVSDLIVDRNASAPISYGTIDNLTLHLGTGDVTVDVDSTAAGVATTINGNIGDDEFNVTEASGHFGDIDGTLTLNGGSGNDSLNAFDNLTLGNSTITVTGSTLASGLSATVNYSSINNGVVFNGGAGNVTYQIAGTSVGNPVTLQGGGGNDTFVVAGVGQNLNALDAPLTTLGGGGANTLIVNDQLNPNADTFTLTSTSVTRTNSALITFSAVGMNRTVNAGTGNNIVNVVSTPFFGTLAFNGGAGLDTIVAPNAVNTFNVTGLNSGTLNNTLSFSAAENLRGNVLADTILFGPLGAMTGTVDGKAGLDILDYSAKTSAVSLNLLTGTAAFTGGVSNFENATGGSGNDVIIGNNLANVLSGGGGNDIVVGNGGNDTITGGAGRDVVIGGAGADNITLGGGDDIAVGGTTSHDANVAALEAIRNEWTSANSYATRVNNIRIGGGANGIVVLQATAPGQTVFDDGAVDTMTGNLGLDWFFTAFPDVAIAIDPGEQFN